MSRFEQAMDSLADFEITHKRIFKVKNRYVKPASDQYYNLNRTQEGKVWRGGIVSWQLSKLNYECPVCGIGISRRTATLDHMEPQSIYYKKTCDQTNFLMMCRGCNARKSNIEFKTWRNELPRYSQCRLDSAIKSIHGEAKLDELLNSRVFEDEFSHNSV